MYVPLKSTERFTVKVPDSIADISLLVSPITGSVEGEIIRLSSNIQDHLEYTNAVFDLVVKGYILSDKTQHIFQSDDKPSEYFDYKIKTWLIENLASMNSLIVEQKKI